MVVTDPVGEGSPPVTPGLFFQTVSTVPVSNRREVN